MENIRGVFILFGGLGYPTNQFWTPFNFFSSQRVS
jgi:hypothetical protein